ncbi:MULTISPECIES: DUF2007-related protein [unclassified Saccharicrinis]|uniref:DUF2007-related protein n=1 Tax=unclassified Saccharicrinis TaxID=2646859 RepID=UPI003D3515B2
MTDRGRIVEIYSGSLWESEMVKSMLKANGINCFLKNNTLNSYVYEPIVAEGVKVMVNEADQQIAQVIVEAYKKSKN